MKNLENRNGVMVREEGKEEMNRFNNN